MSVMSHENSTLKRTENGSHLSAVDTLSDDFSGQFGLVQAVHNFVDRLLRHYSQYDLAAALVNGQDTIMDIYGDSFQVAELRQSGLAPGRQIPAHSPIARLTQKFLFPLTKNPQWSAMTLVCSRGLQWIWAAEPVQWGDARVGLLILLTTDISLQAVLLPLAQTAAVAIAQAFDVKQQQAQELSHLQEVTKKLETRLQETERLSLLTSLTAGIAHEIRNPLTTAKGFLQLFYERLDNPGDQRFLSLTLAELGRVESLVQNFMSLAKPHKACRESFDLSLLLQAVAEFVRPEANLHGVELQTQISATPLWLQGDPQGMKQVLLNILQNAVQACTPKDQVSLQAMIVGQGVEVQVRDTGCGIPDSVLSCLYQPFFTTKLTGTGLGLVVSKKIVEDHHGTLTLSSKLGQGTSVRLWFPL
ncbi:hypothetical protein D2Q93_05315 [Alicyclobacillaceae bacterium I2511]|nr:hypothetical protein D2Q93_05315 [Alicyclobacillaceae bacterium I2511]